MAGAASQIYDALRWQPVEIEPFEQTRPHLLFQGGVAVIKAGNAVVCPACKVAVMQIGFHHLVPGNFHYFAASHSQVQQEKQKTRISCTNRGIFLQTFLPRGLDCPYFKANLSC